MPYLTNLHAGIMRMIDYRIVFTERARDDLIDIGDYIAFTRAEPDISKRFIKDLKNSISQLRNFPYKFPIIQDEILRSKNIRCMPYKEQYVFYQVIESRQTVIIVRIGHRRRKWTDRL